MLCIIHGLVTQQSYKTTDHVRNNGLTADLLPSSYSLTVHVCDNNINMFVYTRNSEHNSLLIPRLPTREIVDSTDEKPP